MPLRTRASKPAKGLKENMGIVEKTKNMTAGKVTKPVRKALADKTNSASDDNASVEIPKKVTKEVIEIGKENNERPRRDRRLPNRFVENSVLNNLSYSKEAHTSESTIHKTHTLTKSVESVNSSIKTPQKPVETSLVANRPRRICRLPSKFEDHSISPNKFIPVQPVHASTPKLQKTGPKPSNNIKKRNVHSSEQRNISKKKVDKTFKTLDSIENKSQNTLQPGKPKTVFNKGVSVKKTSKPFVINNPATQGRTLRGRKVGVTNSSLKTKENTTKRKKSPEGSGHNSTKTLGAKKASPVYSFRVLEDKNLSKESRNPDIYEFTYDPKDEPPPQKKKKRKVVKKKPSKPRTVVFKNNYDRNLLKTLTALKTAIAKKPVEIQKKPSTELNPDIMINNQRTIEISTNANTQSVTNTVITKPTTSSTIEDPKFPERNKSVQIEDIAADFEISLDHQDLNYSPVNSPDPNRPNTPVGQIQPLTPHTSPRHNNDPLNLRGNLSFFDDEPVASSSVNLSVRHPQASPWRIEFESLPIKWHTNSYVKPNMTPAVECSFVNFEDSKKKHVYTNMVPQSNELLPQIVEKNTSNLVQSSIMSFIREVVDKSATKKQRPRSVTPTACIFSKAADTNKEIDNVTKQIRQVITPKKNMTDKATSKNAPNISKKQQNSGTITRQNSRENLKRKNDCDLIEIPAKTPRKGNDIYFGFDDSEVDQENVSPSKNIDAQNVRALRPRARAVLKEINVQGPTRALLPLAVKSKDSERVNRLYEEMKSATVAPVFPDRDALQTEPIVETTDIDLSDSGDSQSVHLFEDIEFAHHLNVSISNHF